MGKGRGGSREGSVELAHSNRETWGETPLEI